MLDVPGVFRYEGLVVLCRRVLSRLCGQKKVLDTSAVRTAQEFDMYHIAVVDTDSVGCILLIVHCLARSFVRLLYNSRVAFVSFQM